MQRYRTAGISGQSVACSPFYPNMFAYVGGQHFGIAVRALETRTFLCVRILMLSVSLSIVERLCSTGRAILWVAKQEAKGV